MSFHFQQAQKYLSGGVSSPVRSFSAVGGTPFFVAKAQGAYLHTSDGKKLVDYVAAWGSNITGHANPQIISAVQQAASSGLCFGTPTIVENELAKAICNTVPAIEMLRFVNSGTEATMTAIRLARGFSKRAKIIKFNGCYHGHSDCLLVKAGSGNLTFTQANSAGVPDKTAQDTLVAEFNNLDSVAKLFKQNPQQIAAVIIEPIAGNMNLIPAQHKFIEGLRRLCDEYGSLLIFDEVMSGFRVALQGAQALYPERPDLCCLGKIIGGGLPVGVCGGRREIMLQLAPSGEVYQAGTLAGNPLAMSAGLATLKQITQPNFYQELSAHCKLLVAELTAIAQKYSVPFYARSCGAMFGIFFSQNKEINTFQHVQGCDQDYFKRFFHSMLKSGVYFAPSPFEAGFVCSQHNTQTLEQTIKAADKAMRELKR